MKKINIFCLIAALLVVITSCDDFLETDPQNDLSSSTYYTTDEEIETAVLAIYDAMQAYDDDNDWEQREFALTEIRSDNSKTSNSEGAFAEFQDLDVSTSNTYLDVYWNVQYNVNMEANTVLQYIDNVTDEDLKDQFTGEAYFARALSHFNLVRAFGDIPIIDYLVGADDSYTVEQATADEVYDFIVGDLTEAVNLLPTRSEVGEGRATEGAARTLLAKVYLEMGEYSLAKEQCEAVIALGDYDLMDDYYDVFYDELNEEIIFAIQYLANSSDDSQDFSYEFTYVGAYSGLNYPTDDFMAVVDTADERYDVLFTTNIYGEYECAKYVSEDGDLAGNDKIVLRYADVLLMYVEAVLAGGESTSNALAVEYFNDVRERAGLETVSAVTKDDLLLERRIEFGFENQRFYDLIRFGEAEETLTAFGLTEEAGFTFDDTDLLLPIPQEEINNNDNLEQNPGY